MVAVDGSPMAGLGLNEVLRRLHGAPGTRLSSRSSHKKDKIRFKRMLLPIQDEMKLNHQD